MSKRLKNFKKRLPRSVEEEVSLIKLAGVVCVRTDIMGVRERMEPVFVHVMESSHEVWM